MSKLYKKVTKDFVVVSNRITRDPNLRLADKGLLTFLLSLPDGWNFSVNGLAAILPEGKDAIGAGVQRLIDAGYVERKEQSRRGGQFSSTEWIIYDEPQNRTDTVIPPFTDFPKTAEPSSDVPQADIPAQTNKDIQNTDLSNTDLSSSNADMVLKALDTGSILSGENDDVRECLINTIRFVFSNEADPNTSVNYLNTVMPIGQVAQRFRCLNKDILKSAIQKYKLARRLRQINHPSDYMRTLLLSELNSPGGVPPVHAGGFNAFSQRSYDYAALERDVLGHPGLSTTDCSEATA